ncbi:MAG: leucine-rich repeat domain-containing protein, partial [Verrucomicrobiae bacterium]|nr:leucine-rich repeat domain-containing protein [Verrucomicrobiae bacterium]
MNSLKYPSLSALLMAVIYLPVCEAVTLVDYVAKHPIKLFIATKGSVMPNETDQSNNLQEGDRALLLSDKGLTDIRGISRLMVEDDGKVVPVTSVANLHVFLNVNQIDTMPAEIAKLENMVFLYCEFNRMSALPKVMGKMKNLVGMYFTSNEFKEIPPFIYQMTWLKKLQFSKNRLTSLPPEIGNLTEIRHFNMSGNEITTIPDSMANLALLRVCDLSDNQITELPEVFGKVQIVNQLRVRNNPLTSLPLGFATMRATIDITGTNIDFDKLPPELQVKISTEKPPGSKEPD